MTAARALLALILLSFATACAGGIGEEARRESVARRIADDAISFNEAYGQAVSGQILLNILRGRDRLPRHYLAMTGINDSPSLRERQNLGFGSVPFGTGIPLRGFGSVGVERETQSRPTYAIQPFSAETLTRTAFQPIEPYVFAHYWQSGWPRDLLLFVLVERMTVSGEGGGEFTNEANNIFEDCGANVDTSGCDFVRAARAMMEALAAQPPSAFTANGAPVCGLIEAHNASVRPADPAAGQVCSPRIVIGARTYTLHLRSLDDAIYYVGELLRAPSMEARGPIETQLTIRAAGLRGGGRGVPLFRLTPASEARAPLYAAEVSYAGTRYAAGPAIGRSCGEASSAGVCVDDAENGDRSSSVISLLAELMALNQSPDAIRAPNRLFVE